MTDDSLISTGLAAIVSTVVGLVILRIVRYLEKRDKSKDEDVKDTMKHANEIIKQQLAQMIKETSEKNQTVHIESNVQLKEELVKKITDELKETKERIKSEVETKTDIQSKVLLNNIGMIENKLISMINSIDMKTSVTTENVTKLRHDVLQIQEEIDSICDRITPETKRDRDNKRYSKKREIVRDKEFYYPKERGMISKVVTNTNNKYEREDDDDDDNDQDEEGSENDNSNSISPIS